MQRLWKLIIRVVFVLVGFRPKVSSTDNYKASLRFALVEVFERGGELCPLSLIILHLY